MASYIIGVDVGYGNTKTAHSCFSSGIKLLSSKPPISTRVIETTSGFYTIGNGKLSIQSSKTEDENMRALTMAGIAEELKRTHTTVADTLRIVRQKADEYLLCSPRKHFPRRIRF